LVCTSGAHALSTCGVAVEVAELNRAPVLVLGVPLAIKVLGEHRPAPAEVQPIGEGADDPGRGAAAEVRQAVAVDVGEANGRIATPLGAPPLGVREVVPERPQAGLLE